MCGCRYRFWFRIFTYGGWNASYQRINVKKTVWRGRHLMSPTIITYIRQKIRAVLFNPSPKAEHGHTRVFNVVLFSLWDVRWQHRRSHTFCFYWRSCGKYCGVSGWGVTLFTINSAYRCHSLLRDVGVAAYVCPAFGCKVGETGGAWHCWGCQCWAGAGAAAALCLRGEGFEDGPTRVPVLEEKGIPVGPAGPGPSGVVCEVLAEADPVVRAEILDYFLDVFMSHCHQVLVTDLTGHERLQSVFYRRCGVGWDLHTVISKCFSLAMLVHLLNLYEMENRTESRNVFRIQHQMLICVLLH